MVKHISNQKNNQTKNVTDEIPREIYFVEDWEVQMYGVASLLDKKEWKIIHCSTRKEVMEKLEKSISNGTLPAIVSIDLGLEDKPEKPDYGLELLKNIRKRWEGLPIIVHSALSVDEETVKTVVEYGASYYYLKDKSDAQKYADLLPFVAQGILVFSQKPAGLLPKVITRLPDPFYDRPEYKRTIRLLAEGLTYAQIAERDSRAQTDRGIMARVNRIAAKLEALNEIDPIIESESPEPYKEAVVNWYKKNRQRLKY